MTTLSDMLHDFSDDLLRLAGEYATDQDRLGFIRAKDDLIEEYVKEIREKLIR